MLDKGCTESARGAIPCRMKAKRPVMILGLLWAAPLAAEERDGPLPVEISRRAGESRIEIRVGGEPFTTYRFDEAQSKPVLFPVYAPGGAVITRGYPINPQAGERTDHPHHTGLWMNYGDVGGFDFWGNARAVAEKIDVDAIVVEGAARTTGATHGRIPRQIRFARALHTQR